MENKVSILIDGGFFVQRFKQNQKTAKPVYPTKKDVELLILDIMNKVQSKSPTCVHHLLRTFYYDSLPFSKVINDMKGKQVDYSKTPVYTNQTKYINSLREIDQFALRLGELSFSGWKINPHSPNSPAQPDFRQKGVDMKIGLDIAWIAGKKSVDKIVLVTGDSDFISPMKLARREGLLIYLYPMGQTSLKMELKEHSDFIL